MAKGKGASDKYLKQIQETARKTLDDLNAERERLRRETNLFSTMDNLKNLTREEVERMSAQVQAGLFIQENYSPTTNSNISHQNKKLFNRLILFPHKKIY